MLVKKHIVTSRFSCTLEAQKRERNQKSKKVKTAGRQQLVQSAIGRMLLNVCLDYIQYVDVYAKNGVFQFQSVFHIICESEKSIFTFRI